MSAEAVYLDSSAFLKLVLPEKETPALRAYLQARRQRLIASRLLVIETLRATQRANPTRLAIARKLLRRVALVPMDAVCDQAAIAHPPELRSLDAIHLATALSLGTALGVVITYDLRLAAAALHHGCPVDSPQ